MGQVGCFGNIITRYRQYWQFIVMNEIIREDSDKSWFPFSSKPSLFLKKCIMQTIWSCVFEIYESIVQRRKKDRPVTGYPVSLGSLIKSLHWVSSGCTIVVRYFVINLVPALSLIAGAKITKWMRVHWKHKENDWIYFDQQEWGIRTLHA